MALCLALAGFWPAPTAAQPTGQGPAVRTGISGGAAYQPRADIDGGGGFSLSRGFIGGEVGLAAGPRNSVGLGVGVGVTHFDFAGDVGLGTRNPWGHIQDYRLSLPVRFGFGQAGSAIVIPSLRFDFEDGADMDDARSQGLIAGASWRLGENLAIGPGFGYFTSLEDDADIFPILLVDWDVTDRLNLSTGRGRLGASQGPGLTLSWQQTDSLSLTLSGRSERREFRLDDDGVAPGGVGQDKAFPLVAGFAWEPSRNLRVAGFAGVELGGNLRLEDADGDRLADEDYDTVPVMGAAVDFRF